MNGAEVEQTYCDAPESPRRCISLCSRWFLWVRDSEELLASGRTSLSRTNSRSRAEGAPRANLDPLDRPNLDQIVKRPALEAGSRKLDFAIPHENSLEDSRLKRSPPQKFAAQRNRECRSPPGTTPLTPAVPIFVKTMIFSKRIHRTLNWININEIRTNCSTPPGGVGTARYPTPHI